MAAGLRVRLARKGAVHEAVWPRKARVLQPFTPHQIDRLTRVVQRLPSGQIRSSAEWLFSERLSLVGSRLYHRRSILPTLPLPRNSLRATLNIYHLHKTQHVLRQFQRPIGVPYSTCNQVTRPYSRDLQLTTRTFPGGGQFALRPTASPAGSQQR